MLQRGLTAVLVLAIGVWAAGCRQPASSGGAAKPGGTEPRVAAPGAEPAPTEAVEVPTGPGRTELERLGISCQQLGRLMEMPDPPYRAVEAIGWQVSDRAGAIVAAYRRVKPVSGGTEVAQLRELERPEQWWLKAPEAIRDLDRVAMCAERMALAAGTMNVAGVREHHAALSRAADRCLPAPVPAAPAAPPALAEPGK
jgi:hypothetical protein